MEADSHIYMIIMLPSFRVSPLIWKPETGPGNPSRILQTFTYNLYVYMATHTTVGKEASKYIRERNICSKGSQLRTHSCKPRSLLFSNRLEEEQKKYNVQTRWCPFWISVAAFCTDLKQLTESFSALQTIV